MLDKQKKSRFGPLNQSPTYCHTSAIFQLLEKLTENISTLIRQTRSNAGIVESPKETDETVRAKTGLQIHGRMIIKTKGDDVMQRSTRDNTGLNQTIIP